MKTTAKRSVAVLLLVAMVVSGLSVLGYRFTVNGEKWSTMRANAHLTENGSFIGAGNVVDRNGEILAYTENNQRHYNPSERIRRSTLHIVGDTEGYIASGVQTAYKTQLTGYSFVTGLYTLKKHKKGNDVTLTIDSNVCAAAYDALDGRNGVVAAYNYITGELICSVSSPDYDIENKPSNEEINENKDGKYEGVYLNRLIDGLYTPGSIFKVVTTVSALQNVADIKTFSYTCEGEEYINGVKVTCPEKHGEMNFDECFTNSCNCAYAVISQKVGSTNLQNTATQMGFGKSFPFGNGQTKASAFDLSLAEAGDVAWAGVGQYNTLVNPYHMLTLVGAVANSGQAVLPYAVACVNTPSGAVISETQAKTENYVSSEIANDVSRMMRNNVKNKYGDAKFVGLSMCGKTGTAEVEEGKEPHSWFVGFSQNDKCPVAIVVIVENGGWGSQNALPIASEVMEQIYKSLS